MKKTTKVFASSIIYAATGILEKCFSFFLLPIYTRYLTTVDYGITDLSRSFLDVMIFVAALSLYSAVNRYYVEYKSEPEKLKRFYGTITLFVLISCLCIFVLLSIFRDSLSVHIFSGIDYYPNILLILLTLIFQCQFSIYGTILRSQQKAKKVSILHLCVFFIRVGLTIFLVVVQKWGATGVLLATLIVDIAYTIFFWVDLLSTGQMVFCLDTVLLKEALSYSIPIIPHNLSTHAVNFISKVLIGNAGGTLADVGIFAIASNFRTVTDTFHTYVNQAYTPWMFEQLHEGKEIDYSEVQKITKLLISATGLILTGVALFSQDYITLFLAKSYEQAKYYAFLVVIVYVIKTAYYYYVTILFYYKEASSKIFIATISSSLINLFLSTIFIPKWNVIGSISADIIAMIIRGGIVIILANRYDKKTLRLKDFLVNLFCNIAVICVGMFPLFYFHLEGFHIKYFFFRCVLAILYFLFLLQQNKDLLKSYNIFSIIKHRKK